MTGVAILFTGLDNKHAAQAVRRLLSEHPEVASTRSNFKFPGRGRNWALHLVPLRLDFCYMQGPLHQPLRVGEALVQATSSLLQGLGWSWGAVLSLLGARLQLLPKDRQNQVAVGLGVHVTGSAAFDRHPRVSPQEGLFDIEGVALPQSGASQPLLLGVVSETPSDLAPGVKRHSGEDLKGHGGKAQSQGTCLQGTRSLLLRHLKRANRLALCVASLLTIATSASWSLFWRSI